MDDDSSGFDSELVITFDTHAGPAVLHGPQAEPDSPPLTRAGVAALEALVVLAVADGITARLEMPAARESTSWPVQWPLPSAWLHVVGAGGAGLSAHGPDRGASPETTAAEIARLVDTAHWELVEAMTTLGRPTNWPPCPDHPTTHPLQLVAGTDADPRPRWSCPLTGVVVPSLPPLG